MYLELFYRAHLETIKAFWNCRGSPSNDRFLQAYGMTKRFKQRFIIIIMTVLNISASLMLSES